ncbi:hypothetical protein SAMN02800687_3225 [Curtobacterium sp. UNCCL20]|nr:hypothetical protein SAMN02800687_3225 [Curtobacterium sp. UNCCL20]
MFAVTVDQIDSRNDHDRVDAAIRTLEQAVGDRAVLAPERTAGDEFQLLLDDADAALDVVLDLTREGEWSVGVGVGDVDSPLPSSTRAARGSAFFRARDAVERAKHLPEHFALDVAPGRRLQTGDVEPLIAQAIRARARRSPEGWELADLLRAGHSRVDAANLLGISPQAVAKRYLSADLRAEDALRAALARLLAEADLPR